MKEYEDRYITDIDKMPQKCREVIEEFEKMGYKVSPEYEVEDKDCVIILFPPYPDAEVSIVNYYPEEDKVDFSICKIAKTKYKTIVVPLDFLKEFKEDIDKFKFQISINIEGSYKICLNASKMDKNKALGIIESFFKVKFTL